MSNERVRDIIGDIVTAYATLYIVYSIVDAATEGALSLSVANRIYAYRERIKTLYERERTINKERNCVQFEAWEAINGDAENGRNIENSGED